MLVQSGQGGGAQDDLVVRLQRVPRQDRWVQSGVCVADQRRNGLSVELEVGVLVVGPGRHIGVAVKETADHRWQIPVVPDRGDGVVPVPSVQVRVGVEIVEAASEGDGRHDDRNGNDGTEHHGARREPSCGRHPRAGRSAVR